MTAIGSTAIEACGQDELVDFARDHLPGRKASTLNREATRPYAAILHYAHNPLKWRDWITLKAFPEEEVDRPPADPGDIAKLIANADRTGSYKPHHYSHKRGPLVDRNAAYKVALLELLHARALRLSDNLRLKRDEDLDLPNGRIRARIGKARGKIKWLPLPPTCVAALAELKPCADGYVFPWRTRSGVYKWLKPLRRRLGVAFTPHMARHALATEALELGVDERIVQEMGAWASRASLKPYQKVAQRLMREADARRIPLPVVPRKAG
ncbi:MAG TPA: tyrosine-type recombinase/integrase [Vineibacter sp.]|nr:tyrosine-type recombinase/integrase [Vineibacter sp.]